MKKQQKKHVVSSKKSASRKPVPGSTASLKKIAAGDENKVATHAARRVLAKREAKAGKEKSLASPQPDEVVTQSTTQSTKRKAKAVEALPDPRTDPDRLDPTLRAVLNKEIGYEDLLVEEMNRRMRGYGIKSEQQVREDFVCFGANDKKIVFDPKRAEFFLAA